MKDRYAVGLVVALALALGAQGGCERSSDQSPSEAMRRNGDVNQMSQTEQPQADHGGRAASSSDASFVAEAAQGNLAEVALGRLAEQKSSNPDVKRFGQHMVEDHTKANATLTELAVRKGFQVPQKPDEAHTKEASRLAELSGAEFDRAYVAMMVKDHVQDVALFERYSKEAADPDVRSFAEKTLPVLQDHLKMARDLAGKVKASGNP